MTPANLTGSMFRAAAAGLGERLYAATREPLPVGLTDQMAAAARDTTRTLEGIAAIKAVPTLESDLDPVVLGYMTLALERCRPCSHLKRPAPAIAVLALERVLCHPCVMKTNVLPDSHADRCDWCHETGISDFWPIHLTFGPILIAGDACDDCRTDIIPLGERDK